MSMQALVVLALLVVAASAAPWTSLYGMSSTVALEAISTTTGQPVEVSSSLPYEAQGQGLATLDEELGIYYIIGTNVSASNAVKLVGVSVATGNVVAETPLPFQSSELIGVGQYLAYDSIRGAVLAVGQDFTTNEYILVRVAPITHKMTRLAVIPDVHMLDVLGGCAVYDPSVDTFWIQLALNVTGDIQIKFYGFSAGDGQLSNIIDNPEFVEAMVYDPNASRLVGLGAEETKTGGLQRTLVYFDSATDQFTVAGTIPEYQNVMSDVLTIDVASRHLIFLAHKSNSSSFDDGAAELRAIAEAYNREYTPIQSHIVRKARAAAARAANELTGTTLPSMDLVQYSLHAMKVMAAPQACAHFPQCPWSIKFANPQSPSP
ncbi:uncharacterized protein AMSG_02963 [Thecamonas trahens ATCC 50062]|uniref:Uncharacterized protein n=1 Tax=Thecamonas trahens ATCC 50062 TaxID=461836 RepID=A0A0L0D2J7_THETB|nr:hypothetical protein AMSG_02963 [Thecamonas trahens ATCC 50062]KNC46527.1 hypothetical protein AMSG_02963 [Thecamonas trahens ATCC 50062]|eukprot:XP_013760308.1 hypothetical protein AMSG_02963 [Thecamonas trahens ATCC 50062]